MVKGNTNLTTRPSRASPYSFIPTGFPRTSLRITAFRSSFSDPSPKISCRTLPPFGFLLGRAATPSPDPISASATAGIPRTLDPGTGGSSAFLSRFLSWSLAPEWSRILRSGSGLASRDSRLRASKGGISSRDSPSGEGSSRPSGAVSARWVGSALVGVPRARPRISSQTSSGTNPSELLDPASSLSGGREKLEGLPLRDGSPLPGLSPVPGSGDCPGPPFRRAPFFLPTASRTEKTMKMRTKISSTGMPSTGQLPDSCVGESSSPAMASLISVSATTF